MKTNFIKVALFTILSFFSIFAIAAHYQYPSNEAKQKDAEVMGVLNQVDQNEMNAAQIAMQRANNHEVKEFAKAMDHQHKKNMEDLKKLASKINNMPMDSQMANMIKQKGNDDGSRLKAASNADFDAMYMQMMVNGHQEVLHSLDNNLIPSASNPELVDFLKKTRATVAHHLEMATKVQNKL